jgi:hypothetical protein
MAYTGANPMLTANATAAVNTTTDVTATAIKVNTRSIPSAALYLYVKGDAAGCAGNITFKLQRSVDGSTWHYLADIVIAMSGTSQVVDSTTNKDLDLTCTDYIRLAGIANSDVIAGRTATCNAYLKLS